MIVAMCTWQNYISRLLVQPWLHGQSGPVTLYVCVCTLLKGQYTYTYVCKLIVITVIMVCSAGLPTNSILANSVEAFNLQTRATQSHTRSDVLFKHQQFEGCCFLFYNCRQGTNISM